MGGFKLYRILIENRRLYKLVGGFKMVRTNKKFTGKTFPQPVKIEKFNLKDKGVKIVRYITNFEPNTPPRAKHMHFKKWLKNKKAVGVLVLLYKGKGKLTTVQKDYSKMDVVGGLFMNNETIMNMFESRTFDRQVRLRATRYLMGLLNGNRKDHKDGLLSSLNHRLWNVTIINPRGRIIFKKRGLPENEANRTLKEELINLTGGTNA